MELRAVLANLVARSSADVRGAVFCDEEGERVEAVINDPALDTYQLDLTGASYATLLPHLSEREDAQLRVVHPRDVVWVQCVQDGYYVVLVARRTGRDVALGPPLREAAEALRQLL